MSSSAIEWTGHTVNPLRARLNARAGHYCEKVSPGCKNCYSSAMQRRFGMPPFQEQRGDAALIHFLDTKTLLEVVRRRKPTTYFWCSMTDMFGEWVPIEWIARCFAVMASTPEHTHQVLTKRPEKMLQVLRALYADDMSHLLDGADWLAGEISACHVGEDAWRAPLPNVWLGTSVEDQRRADERIPLLLETPAAVRFVSAEPLLESVDLRRYMPCRFQTSGWNGPYHEHTLPAVGGSRGLDWVICGGESGNGARPCALEWLLRIVDDCGAAQVPVFVKQLGAYVVSEERAFLRPDLTLGTDEEAKAALGVGARWLWRAGLKSSKGADKSEWPDELRVQQFPEVRRG